MVRNAGVADFLADVDQILSQVAQPPTFRDLFESLWDPVRRNHKGNGVTLLSATAIRFTALDTVGSAIESMLLDGQHMMLSDQEPNSPPAQPF